MRRRRVLTALAGAGLTGASAWVLQNGVGSPNDGEGLPVRVETLDARGSEAGATSVPAEGQPTVVDLFATWCAPCKKQMDALSDVEADVGDEVAFVSVTNERVGGSLSRDDVREWWREHDGDWTVGLDPESDLMAAVQADSLPYVAVADAGGEIQWAHGGVTDAETLRGVLAEVR